MIIKSISSSSSSSHHLITFSLTVLAITDSYSSQRKTNIKSETAQWKWSPM